MDSSSSKTFFGQSSPGKITPIRSKRNCWILAVFNSLPFSTDTFYGWVSAFTMQLAFSSVYNLGNISILSFVLANGLFFEACAHHFETIFAGWSEKPVENPSIETKLEMKRSFIEAVKFHNETKVYETGRQQKCSQLHVTDRYFAEFSNYRMPWWAFQYFWCCSWAFFFRRRWMRAWKS